ncbi:MFS transporter [Nesterenkonia cremea]|uniref:MFS transporter n=1 Tax=Nesterenkonia cremea TaxID=1882340 RepID=A0A917AWP3_9MICC|nr:MFS transporter [Nesterenkonia cremea]GGE76357.1 MFS transporter [Nesterenkonia cremea]
MTTHTENDAVPASPPKATVKQWLGLIIMVVPLFMLATDVTALFLAMPSITADLLPVGSQQLWILHIGEFLSAATMITFGLLASRIGARRLLLSAVTVYGLASLVAAFALNPEILIGGRALLGIAAAAFTPAGMILVRRTFRDPKQYNIAFATYMAAFTGGMAAGPPFGGLILEHFWWGAVFLINVPIAAVLLIGGPFLLERNHADRSVRIDGISVVLSITAILTLVYGLQELSAAGLSWLPLLSSSLGVGLLLLFIRRQRTAAHPLLDLGLFRIRTIRVLLVVLCAVMFSMSLVDMLLPQYIQLVRGLSPLEAGLVLLAPAIGSTVGAMLTPLLAGARDIGLSLAAPLAITGIFAAALILWLPEANLAGLITALTLITLVASSVMTLLSQLMISAAPEEKTGSATALQEVAASLSMASSLALLGAGALALYRTVLTGWSEGHIPEDAVETAGESFGASGAVLPQLDSSQAEALLSAVEEAFTAVLQAGYGAYALTSLLLAGVVVLLTRRRPLD